MTLPDSVNSIIQIVLFVLGAYLLAFYLGLIVWTARDISSRTRDWLGRFLAVLLVAVFNIPGLILYIVLRPRETLAEVYGRALEEEALMQGLEEQDSCPTCKRHVAQDFVVCPYCRTSLKNRCSACKRLLNPHWEVCPYCGEDQAARAPRTGKANATPATPSPPPATPAAPPANPPDEASAPTS